MRRTPVLLALLAVPTLVATAYSVANAAPASSNVAGHDRPVLELSATPSGEGFDLDSAPNGPSIGDEHFETGVLTDSRGRRAGSYDLVGQLVALSARSGQELLSVTLHLPHGDVVTSGGLTASDDYTVAVVGGTGAYSAAAGTLAVRGATTPATFTLTLEH